MMDSNDSAVGVPGRPPMSSDGEPATKNYKLFLVCLLLLGVTWGPLLGIHFYRSSLSDSSTGTAVVVFSPTLSSHDLFQDVIDANGSLVRPIGWFPRAWVVHSLQPGFARRLRERGAWGVFSTELLNPEALLNCMRISAPPST